MFAAANRSTCIESLVKGRRRDEEEEEAAEKGQESRKREDNEME